MTKTTDAGMRERRRSSRVSGNQNSGSRAASAQAPLSATPASADIPAASEAVHGTASRNHNLKKRKVAAISIDDPIEKAMQPLTAEERQSWRGWIELESEPVSVLLPPTPKLFTSISHGFAPKSPKLTGTFLGLV